MFGLPLPLGLALTLSYAGFALIATTAVLLRKVPIGSARALLFAGLGVGATSIALRTVYFLVADHVP